MSIPSNITKAHLLEAISKIDQEGIPNDGDSRFYDVIYNGNKYPPKLIVSYANYFANGEQLDRNNFAGGKTKESFKLLEDNGFVISSKASKGYFEELIKFINQSKTSDLKTSSYLNKYAGLSVKVSFGQGNLARVPWISFLGRDQKTANGIYPVYLLYKEFQKLILAYGVSETNIPVLKWNVDAPTLAEYFENNKIGDPKPYPNSIISKSYDLTADLDEEEINSDLLKLIEIYSMKLLNQPIPKQEPNPSIDFAYRSFYEGLINSKISINQNITLQFSASLLTKPFVILTGLSGSGKTKLAQAFAMWICKDDNQYCIVPVGADWTNREPLLGFPNALKVGEYIKPDNGVLDLIIAAKQDATKPYFLILDEMNLSHVERYFADFLSVMESTEEIPLHSGTTDYVCGTTKIPSKLNLPKNIFIIGTVNIDETTYMFSPKVLDRANVIEFRVTGDEMQEYLNGNNGLNMDGLKGLGANMANNFVEVALNKNLEIKEPKQLSDTLMTFFKELKRIGTEFGYRTASEIMRFVTVVNLIEPDWTITDIMDAAIMQKLLPKLHGSRSKLNSPLTTLAKFCIADGTKDYEGKDDEFRKAYFIESDKIAADKAAKIIYPLSFEKLARMHKNVIENGFTSYAEA